MSPSQQTINTSATPRFLSSVNTASQGRVPDRVRYRSDFDNNLDAVISDVDGTTLLRYDADGTRVVRQTPTETTVFIDGRFEWNDTTSQATVHYQLGGGHVGLRDDGDLHWSVADHLGSMTATVEAGSVTSTRQLYDPWGEIRTNAGAVSVPTDLGFTNQRLDEGTGLMNYGTRYYHPAMGRFISPDTIVPDPSNPQDLNRYNYVRNNPTGHTDQDGQSPCRFLDPGVVLLRTREDPMGGAAFVNNQAHCRGSYTPMAGRQTYERYGIVHGTETLLGFTDVGEAWTVVTGKDTHGNPVSGTERLVAASGLIILPLISVKMVDNVLGWFAKHGDELARKIVVTDKRLQHVYDRHRAYGKFVDGRSSVFFDSEDIPALIEAVEDSVPLLQPASGNLVFIGRGSNPVGVERSTGVVTDIYTVIVDPTDYTLVSAFPGLPKKGR